MMFLEANACRRCPKYVCGHRRCPKYVCGHEMRVIDRECSCVFESDRSVLCFVFWGESHHSLASVASTKILC